MGLSGLHVSKVHGEKKKVGGRSVSLCECWGPRGKREIRKRERVQNCTRLSLEEAHKNKNNEIVKYS